MAPFDPRRQPTHVASHFGKPERLTMTAARGVLGTRLRGSEEVTKRARLVEDDAKTGPVAKAVMFVPPGVICESQLAFERTSSHR